MMFRMRYLLAAALVMCAACSGAMSRAQVSPAAEKKSAPYVLRDGSVQIVSAAGVAGVTRALDSAFAAQHPNTRFNVQVGDNYSAMAALTFDRSLVAPLGTLYTRIGLGDNLKIAAEPIGVRVAHATITPGDGVPALGIIVNAANPVSSLSLTELTRIFMTGAPGGDFAQWSQAGVKGVLAGRAIHPMGPMSSDERDSDDPQAGEFLSSEKLGGLNFDHAYVQFQHYRDIVQRVSEDPAAIGIVALNVPLEGVRVVALRWSDQGRAVEPTVESIAKGEYPLDRFIYIYVRVPKGASASASELPLQYAEFALSEAGQRAIAADSAGYIPLNAGETATERAKLRH